MLKNLNKKMGQVDRRLILVIELVCTALFFTRFESPGFTWFFRLIMLMVIIWIGKILVTPPSGLMPPMDLDSEAPSIHPSPALPGKKFSETVSYAGFTAETQEHEDREREFNDFVMEILTLVKEALVGYSTALFWVNYQKHTFVVRAKVSDSSLFTDERHIPAGMGLLGMILKDPKTILEGNIPIPSALHYYTGEAGIKSFLGTPIMLNDRIVGILAVDSQAKEAFGEEDRKLIEQYAMVVSRGLNIYNQIYEFDLSNQMSRAFLQFISSLNQPKPLHQQDVLHALMETIQENFQFDRLTFAIKKDQELGTVTKVIGGADEFPEGIEFPLTDGLVGWVIGRHQPMMIEDRDRGEYFIPRFSKREKGTHRLRSFLGVPVGTDKRTLGALVLESEIPNFYNDVHKQILMTLAHSTAIALERAQLSEKIEELAREDGLTELTNHRTFMDKLHYEIARSKRFGIKLTLLMIDIDHFKLFNDQYGHTHGDFLLHEVAQTIANSVRKIDIPARYGGEEFTVILIETSLENAELTAQRIRSQIEHTDYTTDGIHFHVTVSIGVSELNLNANEDEKRLVEKADEAMYVAKNGGRNCVRVYQKDYQVSEVPVKNT